MKKVFFWGIMGMLALVSCQSSSDEYIENTNPDTEKWKMTMAVSDSETRASVDENQIEVGSRLPVRWDKSDKIKMMIGTDADNVVPCEFVLQGESSIGSAVFEYEAIRLTLIITMGYILHWILIRRGMSTCVSL